MNESVVRALLQAIESSPDDLGLRRHVAELLISDEPAAALGHLQAVLADEPDDVAALQLAANAASAAGQVQLDQFYGNSEKALHELFEGARRKAPSVMFFDEVDAIGMRRREVRGMARGVIAQLLTELDGITGSNDDVFVLGATNQPWDIDTALRRPGRFDRTVLVLPPDLDARKSIIEQALRDKPVEDLNLDAVAKTTEGYSGADLRLLCDTALQLAMEASVKAGHVVAVTDKHLRTARKSTAATTAGWFDTARNAALFANCDGAYDDLVAYLQHRRRMRRLEPDARAYVESRWGDLRRTFREPRRIGGAIRRNPAYLVIGIAGAVVIVAIVGVALTG